ncbi:MAG: cytochrome C, partial [Acidiphilium sp. 37-67-22]
AFPGGQIAMAPALKPGSVTLADGKQLDEAQMAHDVAAFLAWTADPHRDDRRIDGIAAILFLLVLGLVGAVALGRRRA